MGVTIHVNGTSNSLAHKGCMGIAKSTLPDVCKTPSPGGPIPIPYPIIVSMANSLKKGTKKVKVDGGQSAAIKGSEFSRCSGDEPGTPGGIKSSTNMKEATWILYSFDVKIEGKNACRLSDKMMMNHGNTACLNGFMTRPVILGQFYPEQTCLDARREEIHKQQEAIKHAPPPNLRGLGAKRLGRVTVDCNVIKTRIKHQRKQLRIRLKMKKECFQGNPMQGPVSPNHDEPVRRDRGHREAILGLRNAIKKSQLVARNCCN